MGYHVSIMRTSGKKQIPIFREEVEAIGRAHPLWTYKEDEGALVLNDGDERVELWFSDGEIWTKNPTEATIEQMLRVAEHLKARVRGDELETYRSPADTYLHPDDAEMHTKSRAEVEIIIRKTHIKSFVVHSAIFFFVGLILLFKHLGWIE